MCVSVCLCVSVCVCVCVGDAGDPPEAQTSGCVPSAGGSAEGAEPGGPGP